MESLDLYLKHLQLHFATDHYSSRVEGFGDSFGGVANVSCYCMHTKNAEAISAPALFKRSKESFFFIYILGCHLPRRVAHAISELLLIFLTEKWCYFWAWGLTVDCSVYSGWLGFGIKNSSHDDGDWKRGTSKSIFCSIQRFFSIEPHPWPMIVLFWKMEN